MRDDLMDAHAAVEWARIELQILEREVNSWFESVPYLIVEDLHPEMGSKFFKLQVNRKFPLTINAGAGAVVNSARTSLDMLAFAVAARNGAPARPDVHFPIYETAGDFIEAKNVTSRNEWLSAAELQIVEELKPYYGGNDLLFALYQFDALRMRERLVDVHISPGPVMNTPEAKTAGYRLNAKWPKFEDGAVLGGANINSAIGGFDIVVDIRFNQVNLISSRSVIDTLRRFAEVADEIIKRFDIQ
jgi:hypothetical protein